MRVKIIKANIKSYWYNDKIGQEFNVTRYVFSKAPVLIYKYSVLDEEFQYNGIDFDDCVVIDDERGLYEIITELRREIYREILIQQY